MSSSAGHTQISKAMLVVCDAAGKVQAITSREANDTFPGGSSVERDFAEVFGRGSSIDRSIIERVREARVQEEYSAEARLENGHGQLFIRLESLNRDVQLYGFAVQLIPLADIGL